MRFKREFIKYLCNRMNKSKKEIKTITTFREHCFTSKCLMHVQYSADFIYNDETLTLTYYKEAPLYRINDILFTSYYELTKVGKETNFYGEHYILVYNNGKTIESCCDYLFNNNEKENK